MSKHKRTLRAKREAIDLATKAGRDRWCDLLFEWESSTGVHFPALILDGLLWLLSNADERDTPPPPLTERQAAEENDGSDEDGTEVEKQP